MKPAWDPTQAVEAANTSFYEAFAARDMRALDQLWSTTYDVACIHPGWSVLRGRRHVMASFRRLIQSAPEISCSEVRAIVLGDGAVVTCVERIGHTKLIATNVFALESNGWKMVHHQAAPFTSRPMPRDLVPPLERLN